MKKAIFLLIIMFLISLISCISLDQIKKIYEIRPVKKQEKIITVKIGVIRAYMEEGCEGDYIEQDSYGADRE